MKYHLIQHSGCLGHGAALEARIGHAVHHLGHCDITALEPVEIHPMDLVRAFRDGTGLDKDGTGSR